MRRSRSGVSLDEPGGKKLGGLTAITSSSGPTEFAMTRPGRAWPQSESTRVCRGRGDC